MTKPVLHVPSRVHQQLHEDLPEILDVLTKAFDVVTWSDATPSSGKEVALAAEAAMNGMEVSTAIDCPFMPFVLVGEVSESLVEAAPTYASPQHMVSATAHGNVEDYFPGQDEALRKTIGLLSAFGTPRALSVDGGGVGEVRMTFARGEDGVTCGLFTLLLE